MFKVNYVVDKVLKAHLKLSFFLMLSRTSGWLLMILKMTNNQVHVTLRGIAFENGMIVHFKVVQVSCPMLGVRTCVCMRVCMSMPEIPSSVVHHLLCRGWREGFLTWVQSLLVGWSCWSVLWGSGLCSWLVPGHSFTHWAVLAIAEQFLYGQYTNILSFHTRDCSLSLALLSPCLFIVLLSVFGFSVSQALLSHAECSSPVAGALHSLPMTPFQNLLHSRAEGSLVLSVNAICMLCLRMYMWFWLWQSLISLLVGFCL